VCRRRLTDVYWTDSNQIQCSRTAKNCDEGMRPQSSARHRRDEFAACAPNRVATAFLVLFVRDRGQAIRQSCWGRPHRCTASFDSQLGFLSIATPRREHAYAADLFRYAPGAIQISAHILLQVQTGIVGTQDHYCGVKGRSAEAIFRISLLRQIPIWFYRSCEVLLWPAGRSPNHCGRLFPRGTDRETQHRQHCAATRFDVTQTHCAGIGIGPDRAKATG
jgi:hypothetical protein